jgi:hypothetical protein
VNLPRKVTQWSQPGVRRHGDKAEPVQEHRPTGRGLERLRKPLVHLTHGTLEEVDRTSAKVQL